MSRIILCILSLFLAIPVFAGEYEDAMNRGDNVFLYMYTTDCGYCKDFDSIYKKLELMHKHHFKFVKVDANTQYGHLLMFQYNARYVPFIVTVNAKKQIMNIIPPECSMEYACVDKALKSFVK